jgi:hypothetical protein
MDGQRFDRWAKLLSNGLPRRATLKPLVGAALVAAATGAPSSWVAADNGEQVGDFCDKKNPCKKPLVCVSHECAKDDSAKCEGNGCKKKGKKKKGKGGHSGGGAIHDPAY